MQLQVQMAPDCVGAEVQAMVDNLQSGQVTQPAWHSSISAKRKSQSPRHYNGIVFVVVWYTNA